MVQRQPIIGSLGVRRQGLLSSEAGDYLDLFVCLYLHGAVPCQCSTCGKFNSVPPNFHHHYYCSLASYNLYIPIFLFHHVSLCCVMLCFMFHCVV